MPDRCVNVILTSPFYNTNKKQGKQTILNGTARKGYPYIRYDTCVDVMTDEQYTEFTVDLFNKFERILSENGVVLYNMSYGNNNREGYIKVLYNIITRTPFTVADTICWKKKSALPNNCSPNKLTRIWEYVFVICRKSEVETFYANKKVVSLRETGQKSYENIFNFIEAKNNDGSCPLNKATYSSDLCRQLLNIYAPEAAIIYDPFMGTGTTAIACSELGLSYIGSEISKPQCEWAENRLKAV